MNESSNIRSKIGKENEQTLLFYVRTAKCTSYMCMTVRFLVPTSCAAEDAQFDENVELTTAPSVHVLGWGT